VQLHRLTPDLCPQHDSTAERAPELSHPRSRWLDVAPLELHLPGALRDRDIRRACIAVEHILGAAEILDDLPPAALEQIGDCTDYNRGRKGTFSEFRPAGLNTVIEHLNDARLRERRLYTGITGREDYEERTSFTGSGDYEEHDKW
jgi:hypothetical protein